MKKIVYTKENHPELKVVNTDTGEIVSGVATLQTNSLDEFMMFFLGPLGIYKDLSGNCNAILYCCWKYSSFADSSKGNLVTSDPTFKNQVRGEGFELSNSTIDNCLSVLCKKGLLIRLNKGRYMMNPDYFFKGNIRDRAKLQATIMYNPL